jgi:hypothetical protein
MSTDQEFWEQTAVSLTRVLLQGAIMKIEVAKAIAIQERTMPEFAAELAAETADLLLRERNKRIPGHPTNDKGLSEQQEDKVQDQL